MSDKKSGSGGSGKRGSGGASGGKTSHKGAVDRTARNAKTGKFTPAPRRDSGSTHTSDTGPRLKGSSKK